MFKYQPLGSRILVERNDEPTKSAGGLLLVATPKSQEGTVIAVGPGDKNPVDIQVGERVLFRKDSGTDIKLDGTEYLVVKEEDVYGVFED